MDKYKKTVILRPLVLRIGISIRQKPIICYAHCW